MLKQCASFLILLALLTPVLPVLRGPGGNAPSAAGPDARRVRLPGSRAAVGCTDGGPLSRIFCRPPYVVAASDRDFLAALARLNHAMHAGRRQENALAGMLGADRRDDVRDYEKRLSRGRVPHHWHDKA